MKIVSIAMSVHTIACIPCDDLGWGQQAKLLYVFYLQVQEEELSHKNSASWGKGENTTSYPLCAFLSLLSYSSFIPITEVALTSFFLCIAIALLSRHLTCYHFHWDRSSSWYWSLCIKTTIRHTVKPAQAMAAEVWETWNVSPTQTHEPPPNKEKCFGHSCKKKRLGYSDLKIHLPRCHTRSSRKPERITRWILHRKSYGFKRQKKGKF